MAVKTQLVNGAFQDNEGNPLSNGLLRFTLSHESTTNSPSSQVISGITTKIFLDNNGNVAGTQSIWTNDVLSPAGSFYTVDAFNNKGLAVWGVPQYWTLVSGSPIDLGTIADTNP